MKKIIVTMIRPRLEYAAVVWSPYEKKNMRKLERVQRAATKMVLELRDRTYEGRLSSMGLTTLERRRERGDLIVVYRVASGVENLDREDLCVRSERETRGHGKKLRATTCRRDVKKFSFPNRSIELWNGLEEEVVCARNIHDFKEKLEKRIWSGQREHSSFPVGHN